MIIKRKHLANAEQDIHLLLHNGNKQLDPGRNSLPALSKCRVKCIYGLHYEIVLLVFPRRGEIFQEIINKIDSSCFNMKQDESSGLVWISLLPVAWSSGTRPFIHLEDVQLIGKAPVRRCSSPPALC